MVILPKKVAVSIRVIPKIKELQNNCAPNDSKVICNNGKSTD